MSNEVTVKSARDMQIGSDGNVDFKTVGDQLMWAQSMIDSGMLPQSYKKASQVVAAMSLASDLNMKPGISTLRRTANINGTPSIYAEMPLAVVQASGKVGEFEGYYFDKQGKQISLSNGNIASEKFGFYCRMKRQDNGSEYEDHYTIAEANKARLGPVWNKHPEDMLRWRTIGKVLKVLFADVLSGAPIAEYDYNTSVGFDSKDVDLSHMDEGSVDMDAIDKLEDDGEILEAQVVVNEPERKEPVKKETAKKTTRKKPTETKPVEEKKTAPEKPKEEPVQEPAPEQESVPEDAAPASEPAPGPEEYEEPVLKNPLDFSDWDLVRCGKYELPLGDDAGKKIGFFGKDDIAAKEKSLSTFLDRKKQNEEPVPEKAEEMLAVLRQTLKNFEKQ